MKSLTLIQKNNPKGKKLQITRKPTTKLVPSPKGSSGGGYLVMRKKGKKK